MKPKPKIIELQHGDRVIAVVPERCFGPGWSNGVAWVYIQTQDGGLETECIQPTERTPEMHALFKAGEAMATALIDAVPTRIEKASK